MQTKKKSLIEAIANTVIGLMISYMIQAIIYPLLNIPVSTNEKFIITAVFFIVSFLRGYVVRRFFEGRE